MISSLGKFIAFVIAFCWLAACPWSASAQNDSRYQTQVYNALMQGAQMKQALSHNYNLLRDGYKQGYIETGKGNYQTATFYLEAGYVYLFVGACDSDCRDLDFELQDANERAIARDTDPDDTPVIQFQPSSSGNYTIVAAVPGCNAIIGCYWAVQAFWK